MVIIRAVAVAASTASVTILVHDLVTEPLMGLARAVVAAIADRDPTALALPLDQLVVGGAALALGICWLWLVLGVVSAALDIRLGPRWVRTLVAVALGVTALHGPASAEPSGERAVPSASGGVLNGLPLPDRAVAAAASSPTAARTGPVTPTLRVRAGDSLWSIAAALLPPGASASDVDTVWRHIADANRDVLGPDPDLIFPGTSLRVPPLDSLLGKENP